MTTPQGTLADELDYWIGVIGDRIGRDRRFSETAKDAIAILRQAAAPRGREAEDSRRIEVDIGAAMTALQASPELCEMMNEMVGGPALVEAQAEIERLNAIIALTPAVAPDAGAGELRQKITRLTNEFIAPDYVPEETEKFVDEILSYIAPQVDSGREETHGLSIRIEQRPDGGIRIWSPQVRGLILSGSDPVKVLADVWPAITTLISHNGTRKET